MKQCINSKLKSRKCRKILKTEAEATIIALKIILNRSLETRKIPKALENADILLHTKRKYNRLERINNQSSESHFYQTSPIQIAITVNHELSVRNLI